MQIREKDLPDGEYEILARQIVDAVKNRPVRIFLNSRISMAKKYVTSLHLPDGADIAGARKTLGPDTPIGSSCHSLESAQTAERDGASFILFGPVFSPISKSSTGAPLGLKALEAVSKKIRLPVVAVGGITPNTAADCTNAGAAAVASVGALMETDDPKETLAEFEKSLGGAL